MGNSSSSSLLAAEYTPGEEVANTLSALLGLVVIAAVTSSFLAKAAQNGDRLVFIGTSVFLLTTAIMYGSSALYHSLRPGKAKHRVRLLDHAAIFLLIAGTYAPLALGPLRTAGGLVLLTVEWALALAGIGLKLWGGYKLRHLANALYLVMGWSALVVARPFIQHTSLDAFLWLLGGGVVYTLGVAFYVAKHKRYAHFVWHLFVFGGNCCHGYAIWRYVL